MTLIDTGMFTVEEDRASFVGAKHQRTSEYKKIVGYNTDADSEVLIAVTNRQKMSGMLGRGPTSWSTRPPQRRRGAPPGQ